MRKVKLLILMGLLLGIMGCKHEFEEVSYWSWYTKAELLGYYGNYVHGSEYHPIKLTIDDKDYSYLLVDYYVKFDHYFEGLELDDRKHYVAKQPKYNPKLNDDYLKFPQISKQDSLNKHIWKIVYLKKGELRVKRVNELGSVHKLEFKIIYK